MTELIWDGKYDTNGKKVVPPRIALPFQIVETMNESDKETEWRNRGDPLGNDTTKMLEVTAP